MQREGRVRRCTTGLRREHAIPSETSARTMIARERGRSSGQTVAALGAASLQHGAAATSGHASAEAVLLGTLQVVGLKGALQRRPPQQAARGCGKTMRTGTSDRTDLARTMQGYGLGTELGNQAGFACPCTWSPASPQVAGHVCVGALTGPCGKTASVTTPARRAAFRCPHCVDNDVDT